MNCTTADILRMPDSPKKRAMLRQLGPVGAKPRLAALAGNGQVLALSITISLYTTTESNAGGHFVPKLIRAKKQRNTVRDVLIRIALVLPPLPAVITMTRIARRELDDDNLHSSLKHVRDGIADVYRVDDRDKRYSWVPKQEIGAGYAVRISIETRKDRR